MTRLISLLVALAPLTSAASWWQPAVSSTWSIELISVITPASIASNPASIIDTDLFDTPASTIAAIHSAGKKAICYFSAGTYEDWRPDAEEFSTADYAKPLEEWEGESWLIFTRQNVRDIMKARLDIAQEKGCDAVDPDNIDAFHNDSGTGVTRAQTIEYIEFLSTEAHNRGLAVGLKNGLDIVKDVVDLVDFAVNEQCQQYEECHTLAPFVDDGKPVFAIEYPDSPTQLSAAAREKICNAEDTTGFSILIKKMNLDSWVHACPV